MYSLGIIFFEMITLKFPYVLPRMTHSFDFDEFRKMHCFQTPKLIRAFRSDIPAAVEQVIQKMLEKNPRTRFDNWDMIRIALSNAWVSSSEVHESSSLKEQILLIYVSSLKIFINILFKPLKKSIPF